jgi:5'-3' exonuclease|tara:strand:- start:258 stop:1208 length:951 start_codon:yes stop_codon:yes gene_type:complete
VIDAMNMLIRSFSLLKAMSPTGHHIGGLVGFLRSLGYVTRIFDPTRVVVVWDGKGGSGNRQNINPDYKAHRATNRITHWGLYDTKQEETEALVGQLFRTKDYLECLPVHQIMMEKLEADDIIAYLAQEATRNKKKVTIISSDKDFLQMINEYVEVYAPVKKKVYTAQNTKEEIKVIPENYNLVKALLGDNSDGLRGVKGLGIKTIVSEFPDVVDKPKTELDYIFNICEKNIEGKKIFSKIIHQWDKVETNFKLMNLHESVLDKREKDTILDIIKSDIPDLQAGAFLHLLDSDRIEGITKNTEGWLENFRGLTVFKK